MFYLWQILSVLSMVEREPAPKSHFLQTRYGRFDTRSFILETHLRVKRRCFSYGLLHGEGGQGWLHCVSPKDSGKSLWCQDNPETLKQKRPLCPLHQDWNLRRLHRIVLLGTEATTKLARKTRPSHLLVPGTRRYNRSLTFVPRLWGEQILFYICGTIGSVKEWIFSNNALQGLVTYHKNGGYLPHRKREHWQ
ncbi:predicted protein [Histoplasma capsulatum G186AR]|uniref:Uncharacterized protein n=1 Tax=Ajellomyces capsulatus (strain G186AR / H82 / ATCC MYA-2454 / RMSCC 2432) TaxID=447093 RepID=C0NY28_AJECG|nr:uncharacterized protein HCBG_07822 [Histoplasma capsulatum G186AR]EEH03696.1 predicted protein [Histoplasma capsulatum G186AR]